MSKRKKFCCPVCEGTGEVTFSVPIGVPALRKRHKIIAVKMRKKGYTIRNIMKALGYTSPGSISYLLNPATHRKGYKGKWTQNKLYP